MVFARTKLMLQDNCFEGEPGDVELKYVGPHCHKLYKKFYETLKSVFKVPASAIQEEKFNWGKGETEKMGCTWYVHKDMDRFTYLYIKISLSASGTEKAGVANIAIKPYLRSEYPQDTIWQRSLFYEFLRTFWHRVFYHRRRGEYNEECRHLVVFLQERLREIFEELRGTSIGGG